MPLPEVRTGLKSEGSAGEHTDEVPPWEPKDSHRGGAPWREAPQGTGRAQTGHEVLFVDRQRGREGTWLPRGGARAGAQISSSPEAPSPFLKEPFHHLKAQLSPGSTRPWFPKAAKSYPAVPVSGKFSHLALPSSQTTLGPLGSQEKLTL